MYRVPGCSDRRLPFNALTPRRRHKSSRVLDPYPFATLVFSTYPMALIVLALRRLGRKIYSNLFEFGFATFLFSWDAVLVLGNLFTPKLAEGKVIAAGKPGSGGHWPDYQPPAEGASRCSCPALNAMANHGTAPHHCALCQHLTDYNDQVYCHATGAISGLPSSHELCATRITLRQLSACSFPASSHGF